MSKFIVILCFLLAHSYTSSAETKNVLWLGNSYTYFHAMPKMVQELAKAAGHTISYDTKTNGGWTLQKHASSPGTKNKINSRIWDVVVLQEQSQRPVFGENQVCAESVAPQNILAAIIREGSPNAVIQFYGTWGRPGADEFPLWQYWLTRRYKTFACMISKPSRMAPVGEAFAKVEEKYGPAARIALYEPNDHHPSVKGSYLSACMHYLAIFGVDGQPKLEFGNYYGGLGKQTALNLQEAAKEIWYGDDWTFPDDGSCSLDMGCPSS